MDHFCPWDKFLCMELPGQRYVPAWAFFQTYCQNAFQKDCTNLHSLQQCVKADFPLPMPALSIIILFNHCQSDQQREKKGLSLLF
jgi:hypothetical protein